jgi:hypothetical protein
MTVEERHRRQKEGELGEVAKKYLVIEQWPGISEFPSLLPRHTCSRKAKSEIGGNVPRLYICTHHLVIGCCNP